MDWDSSGSIVEISDMYLSARRKARRSLAIVFALLALIVLPLAGCDSESLLSSPGSDSELALRVLDNNAMILGHIDISSGLEFIRSFAPEADLDGLNTEEGYSELVSRTGIDPLTDIKGAYFALSQAENDTDGALLMFIDFDQVDLIELIEEQEEMIRLTSTDFGDAFRSPDDELFIAFHEGRLMLLASTESELVRMSDRMTDGGPSAAHDELIQKVNRNQHWAVIRNVDQALLEGVDLAGELGQLGQISSTIEEIGLSASFTTDDIEASLFIRPIENVSPEDLESLIAGIRAAARIQLAETPEILEFTDRFDISSDSRFVEVSIELETEELRELQDQFGEDLRSTLSKRFHKKSQD